MKMDADASAHFAACLDAMDQAQSSFELWEARGAAGVIAREHGMSFDQAVKALRSPPPPEGDDDDAEGANTTDTVGCAHFGSSAAAEDDRAAAAAGASAPNAAETVHSRSSEPNVEARASHLSTDAPLAEALAAALAADPSRSDRDLARSFGISPTTAGRARAAAGLSDAVRQVHRNGRAYGMRRRSPAP